MIKIIKVFIKDSSGKTILKPDNKIINKSEIEDLRKSLKKEDDAEVLFTYEEIV